MNRMLKELKCLTVNAITDAHLGTHLIRLRRTLIIFILFTLGMSWAARAGAYFIQP